MCEHVKNHGKVDAAKCAGRYKLTVVIWKANKNLDRCINMWLEIERPGAKPREKNLGRCRLTFVISRAKK